MDQVQEDAKANPYFLALLLVLLGGTLFAAANYFRLRNERRPAVRQVIAQSYIRPSKCPVRDYSDDKYIYRGCADKRYALDGYSFGIDPLEWGSRGTWNQWYRIDNDAYDLDCSAAISGPCRNRAVVKNQFAQKPHGPALSYYRCGAIDPQDRPVC
jgi:hypothetical protein